MRRYIFLLIAVAQCLAAAGQGVAEAFQSLNGTWTMRQARLASVYSATVPGVVQLDLLNNGLIPDPFVEMNERFVQWADKEDWIYETTFEPSDSLLACGNVELCMDGIDTYADVFLNDEKVITADNMFRRWQADVSRIIRKGENRLTVHLHSPVKIDMPKWEALPFQYSSPNDQSQNGGLMDRQISVFARKAGYHYGWDWGPRIVTMGIWRGVSLRGWNIAKIADINIQQQTVTKARAQISAHADIIADTAINGAVLQVVDRGNGKVLASKTCSLKKGSNAISVDFAIKNPRLWWCNGLGKPDMYSLETRIVKNGKPLARRTERIGLRSVKVVTEPDADGHMQFYFVLNGVPVFAKGTNYIPQDNLLPRVSDSLYRSTLADAVSANMNMIRIWGGGIYENDIFYDICDEMGLMVWQDFMFACTIYPASGQWLESVRQEAIDNVKRLRNHPSIVIWCGGNETLDAWYNWGWKKRYTAQDSSLAEKIEAEHDSLYFGLLPSIVAEPDAKNFYWPSSPFSGKGHGSDRVNGDFHYYGVGMRRLPIATYNNLRSHFFSEYGVQSFPEMSTIERFAPGRDSLTINDDVMSHHQRAGQQANSTIAYYLETEYRPAANMQEFVYLSQLVQADAMRTAVEAHRRHRPYCMGTLLWQHNDCWPVASWSTRDYYGNWKAAHYAVARSFRNLITSAYIDSGKVKIYVLSDLLKPIKGKLTISLHAMSGALIKQESIDVTIPAGSSPMVCSKHVDDFLGGVNPAEAVLAVGITPHGTDAEPYTANFYLTPHSAMNIEPPKLTVDISSSAPGEYAVTVSSQNFARAVCLSVDGASGKFSDNYFDLLPGETKTCTVKSELNISEFRKKLKVNSYTRK